VSTTTTTASTTAAPQAAAPAPVRPLFLSGRPQEAFENWHKTGKLK
jgi:hypothetical protein